VKIVITGGGGLIGLKLAKALLREWEKRHPGRVETKLNSLKHMRSSYLRGPWRIRFRPPATEPRGSRS